MTGSAGVPLQSPSSELLKEKKLSNIFCVALGDKSFISNFAKSSAAFGLLSVGGRWRRSSTLYF